MAPTPRQVTALYRQLLLRASKFDNYNFREYFKRRIHDEFRVNRALEDDTLITSLYNQGITELAMLERQSSISQMFTFDKLVVEPLRKHH